MTATDYTKGSVYTGEGSVFLRDVRPDDAPFIVNAWSRSYEHAAGVAGADPNHYKLEMALMIGRVLRRCSVRIAYDSAAQAGADIVGFACFTGDSGKTVELHYVYVRGGERTVSLRRLGLARMLLHGLPIKSYTFRTAAFEQRFKPRQRGWAFTPRFTL